ncbi:MAG: radical SAM protein [Syntrophomonadaceae bacterium]
MKMLTAQESPQYVQTSLAGAICLGMEKGRFMPQSKCKCLNLLLTYKNGCAASCSYCGLSRNRCADSSKTFIRVKWPTYALEDILARVEAGNHPFKRVCVSMITHRHSVDDTCQVIEPVRARTGLPVSALVAPTVMKIPDDLYRLKAAGADRIGVAIDAATRPLFEEHRGAGVRGPHRWEVFWNTLAAAAEIFGPYRAGIHLIVGLGETEEEMVAAINLAYRMGALTHLFSFYPEDGSVLYGHPQPPLGQYRRIQMARHLINEGITGIEAMNFSPAGRIIDFGVDIQPYLGKGEAFMTSGCPGEDGQVACNRPFGNERASEPMRNYPFVPGTEGLGIIIPQLWDGVE